jgi:ArsR family transcriptional regulator, cadmium/lead-responsive transcriptional repressor
LSEYECYIMEDVKAVQVVRKERLLQEQGVGTQLYPEVKIGRESEDMCLLAQFFNGFANSTRLSILLLLARQGETKVGELVSELGAPQPRVSDHLRCLAWCGYVKVRREGRNAYYSVADDRVLEMLSLGESLLRDNLEHVEACDIIKNGGC